MYFTIFYCNFTASYQILLDEWDHSEVFGAGVFKFEVPQPQGRRSQDRKQKIHYMYILHVCISKIHIKYICTGTCTRVCMKVIQSFDSVLMWTIISVCVGMFVSVGATWMQQEEEEDPVVWWWCHT